MLSGAFVVALLGLAAAKECQPAKKVSPKKWNGYEYIVSETYLDMPECLHYCASQGMQAASIHSSAEAVVTNSFCQEYFNDKCWVGMECVDGMSCSWTDGTPLDWDPYYASNTIVKTFFQCAATGSKYNVAGYYANDCLEKLPCMCKAVAKPECNVSNVQFGKLPVTFDPCVDQTDCSVPGCGLELSVHLPMCLLTNEDKIQALYAGQCCSTEPNLCCDMTIYNDGVVTLERADDSSTVWQWKLQATDKYGIKSALSDCVVKVGPNPCPTCT